MSTKNPIRNHLPENPSCSEPGAEDLLLVDFFNSLTGDTELDKCDWTCEKPEELRELTPYSHPLFTETCSVADKTGHESKEIAVYNSKSFGPDCHVCGDCFYTKLEGDVRLYLIYIEKNEPSVGEQDTKAIEAVFWSYEEGGTITVTSLEKSCLAWTMEGLYKTVALHSRYPLLTDKALAAVEAYFKVR